MSYVDEIIEQVVKQHPNEPEFHQAGKKVKRQRLTEYKKYRSNAEEYYGTFVS